MWVLWRLLGPLTRHLPKRTTSLVHCPWCGYEHVPQGRILKGGVSPGTPAGPDVHWCETEIECPRCRYRYELFESD